MLRIKKCVCFFVFILTGLFLSLWGEAQEHGEVLTAVAPAYPLNAYRVRLYGVVQVEIEIDSGGQVISAKVAGERNFLSEMSEEAARKWKFAATASKHGIRKYRIVYRFVLMPDYTEDKDLGVIYVSPLEMEVRIKDEPFEPLVLPAFELRR
jgi:TonB family protein